MHRILVLAVAALVSAAAAAVSTSAAPGRVTVYGPATAKRVLVLVPGLGGGAGTFAVIGPEIARRVPSLQVWAVDRPGDVLEDRSGFSAGDPVTAYRYYFDRLGLGSGQFDPDVGRRHPEARRWGAAWALADLRKVVLRARAGGRRVLLGGHSLGAATAVTYAAWDFAGRPGYRDLAGLVLIDGGQLGTFGTPTATQTGRELTRLRTAPMPFEDTLGVGAPWVFGVLAQLAAWHASRAPDAPSVLAGSPLVPPAFRPPGSPTNAEFFGFAARGAGIDVSRCGLAAATAMVGSTEPNAFDWYFPSRLRIDLVGAASLARDPVTTMLGLGGRLRHLKAIDVPVYAFATGDIPATLAGAKRLVTASRSPAGRARLVADPAMRHSDPLCTLWERSRFLRTLAGWLRRR